MDTFSKTSVFFFVCFGTIYLLGIIGVTADQKYDCVLPEEPLFGSFVFNDRKKSLTLVCNEGFYMTGAKENAERRCINGKWSGVGEDCKMSFSRLRKCPRLNNPRNGHIFLEGQNVGNKAHFICDSGFLLEGSETMTCQPGYLWSGILPICSSRRTAEDLARDLENKLVDKFAASTSDSTNGVQSKLSVGKSGLDIVFAVDTSSSIGPTSLQCAKDFMTTIVKIFGVSNDTKGGKDGTRVALIQFSSVAKIVFNLDDKNVRSVQKATEEIAALESSGGGTNFVAMLDSISVSIYLNAIERHNDRRENANRAIFLITDAEENKDVHGAKTIDKINSRVEILKTAGKFEIFTIGVGKNIDKSVLSKMASAPAAEHVFLINDFTDLQRIGGIIAETNIDYAQCGISGNFDTPMASQGAKKGAWPWLGWISVYDGNYSLTCGGALLCNRWFVTLASCVSTVNSTGHIESFSPDKMSVYLADHDLYKRDDTEIMARVQEIHLHDNYTGELLQHDVRLYDIALLDLGENNTERPTLNKHIRPICFPLNDSWSTGIASLILLQTLQAFPDTTNGYTAGWGHAPDNLRKGQLLSPDLKQNLRQVRSKKECRKRYRGLDVEKFFCVGNLDPEMAFCRGDIGGPYMSELRNRRFTLLGLALKTDHCEMQHKFNFGIFLNVMDPLITQWAGSILDGCNRIQEIPN